MTVDRRTSLPTEEAFTQLFHEHYESVLRYAWRRAGAADAADIAAETFKIAWEKRDKIPDGRVLPWLYATARNVTANLIRKDQGRHRLTDRLRTESGAAVEGDHASTVAARQAALAALGGLNEDDRELLLLMSWEGLDLGQASTALGCSRPAAAMRLHRLRKQLRHLIAEQPSPQSRPAPSASTTTA
jgi:RNA polymerase sigma-70 factor (ECF subfamily)